MPVEHKVRQFGVRVSQVEPSFTRINPEVNAAQAAKSFADYQKALGIVTVPSQQNV